MKSCFSLYLFQDVLSYYRNSGKFHLIAHSYGSYVAIKLAAKLESEGKAGRVTFIDGAPALINSIVVAQFKGLRSEDIENAVIGSVFSKLYTTVDTSKLKEILSQSTWQEKVDKAVAFPDFDALVAYGKDYLKLMAHALLNRIKIVLNTDLKTTPMKAKPTLIKPTTATVSNISEDFDLQKYFKEELEIMTLEGDHLSILENHSLHAVLNNIHHAISSN